MKIKDRFIKVLENDNWIIDYDRKLDKYRASYFQDDHFVDECWFNCCKENEFDNRCEKIIERLERVKCSFEDYFSTRKQYLSPSGVQVLLDQVIELIKNTNGE